jgi:WD repeat-containing protein WRAP73
MDGRYFVLAERHKSKDTLGVYDALDAYKLARVSFRFFWSLVHMSVDSNIQHVLLPSSSLSSISLSPTGNHLAVWEGPLEVAAFSSSLYHCELFL